jgi:pilus assembly protein CpaD
MRPDPRDFMMLVTPLLLAAAILVTGCTPDAARWTPAEAPKQNKVELVTMSHQVRFAPNAVTPANGEEKSLADFLDGIERNYGDQITIDAGPHGGNAAADALAAKRIDTVITILRKLGVRAQVASRPSVDGALTRDGVVVTLGRYVVTGPNCPDRSKPESDDYTNTTQSNYGCATVTNLGLMVANPGDLLLGKTPGPADGDYMTKGIQNYRAGTISKTLKSELPGGGSN